MGRKPTALPVGRLTALLALCAGFALANPLLENAFWQSATPADVERAARQGADVKAMDKDGATPLHYAARYNGNPEVIALLVRLGAEVNARAQGGWAPLHTAAAINGNPEVVLALLELGADPKARTLDGSTAWDLVQRNDRLRGTPAYWRLNDLRF
ncbi:ankyrin repeat domain-containing protein [Calidithermus chliarophilus]|uniref:ankyrin repeat domain-containing protein n=1 Tax=Calidithermus chliarophilus TaxID=52023 RepID=UPI0004105DDD|nr:ankyrin repeat domain-containing protein [Calidithermus chliarophilus]